MSVISTSSPESIGFGAFVMQYKNWSHMGKQSTFVQELDLLLGDYLT